MDQFMSASTIQFVSTNLTNLCQLHVLKRSDSRRHKRKILFHRNGAKSVDLLDLRQLKIQGWTTKVDRARLGSENEFNGVTSCTSVGSSGESKVGLLDSGNRATLDRYNVVADKLTTAVSDTSGWSSPKYAWRP
jgi:hypothetical protein